MPLLEEFESFGNWLFRWRSYLPLILAALVLSGVAYFEYPLGSHLLDQLWELICLAVSLLGLVVRALTIGFAASQTSGRNTTEQVADRLNTTGMYSIVRNPLYFGNFLMVFGVVIFLRVWWIPVIYTLLFALYYERIIFAEEKFLRRKFGQAYLDWASKTPAFIPRISLWKAVASSFSWRKLLRREYHGVAAVVFAMFLLEVAGDVYQGHGFKIDALWAVILSLTGFLYLVVRFLHKHTTLLRGDRRRASNHGMQRIATRCAAWLILRLRTISSC
jgi:protein-S-isoprenylcysteine O-methyltransferase Ste14